MTRRGRAPRSGVVYVAILIVCVVLLIGIAIYHISMRQGRMAAYRSLDTQYAHSLARAGANLAQASLASALHDPASPLRQKLTEPLEGLQAAPGGIVDLGPPRDLAADFPAVVDELCAEVPGGRGSLTSLTARFFVPSSQLKRLPSLPLGGKTLQRGGREKAGRLFLECTAVMNTGGLLGKITQQVVAYEEFRVVHAPVPVLSDFTLFLRDVQNGADERSPANALEATQLGLLDPASGAVPLVLDNGKKFVQRIASSELKPELLREQGWVFLGGNSVVLNLSYSQDETANPRSVGEDFHFYQQDPGDLEAGRAFSDDALSRRANQHLPGNQFWQVRTWDMGVHSLKDGDLQTQYERIFQRTPAGRRLGSVLKLFGTAPDQVSPTVVFGHVLSGFFRIAAVVPANPDQTDFDGFYTLLRDNGGGLAGFLVVLLSEILPNASRILYVFDPYLSGKYVYMDPADPGKLLGLGRGATEDTYRELCAGFKTRAYNVGLLHLKAGNQVPDPKDRFSQLGLPESLFRDDLARPEPHQLPGNLLPGPWSNSLDKLDLSAMDAGAIGEALEKTCCWKSRPTDRGLDTLRGLNMLRGDRLDLGSTVSIKGPLSLPALSAVERGGMIVADEIVIEGPIPRPAKGVLVLVAKEGGIRFPGGATRIHASLIALKGTLTPGGPPNVVGNLVGNRLDFTGLGASSGGQPASLAYDPRLKGKPLDLRPPATPSEGLVVDFSRRFIRVD